MFFPVYSINKHIQIFSYLCKIRFLSLGTAPSSLLSSNRSALCCVTYMLGTFINQLMVDVSHTFVILFPLLGAAFLLTLLPIATYASYPADFLGLNPVNPKHFVYIAKKTWGSMKQNDLKVKSKDL
jgi:hypothetical protein